MPSISNNIRPTKYPVDPDAQADLLDQAVNASRTGKQDTLVSGTNIKTINGSSILGEGNLTVSASGAPQIIAKKTMISHTGTSTSGNALIASENISSYITANMLMTVTQMTRKQQIGSSSMATRLYVNTSATLTGATLIATFTAVGGIGQITVGIANFAIDASNNLYCLPNTQGYGATTGAIVAIPSPCFLLWAQQTPNGDIGVLLNSTVTKYV